MVDRKLVGSLHHSGHVLVLARWTYDRIGPTGSESQVVVILAAIAIEAFLHDLEHFAVAEVFSEHQEHIGTLGEVLRSAETNRVSPLYKIELAHLALTGHLPNRGGAPYQDLALLFKLRNLLVHARPEKVVLNPDEDDALPDIVRAFAQRGVINAPPTGAALAWSPPTSCEVGSLSPPFLVPDALQSTRSLRALRILRLLRLVRGMAVATIGLRTARRLLRHRGFITFFSSGAPPWVSVRRVST